MSGGPGSPGYNAPPFAPGGTPTFPQTGQQQGQIAQTWQQIEITLNAILKAVEAIAAGGGGTPPGGAPGDLQFNNAGAFDGVPAIFDGTNLTFSETGDFVVGVGGNFLVGPAGDIGMQAGTTATLKSGNSPTTTGDGFLASLVGGDGGSVSGNGGTAEVLGGSSNNATGTGGAAELVGGSGLAGGAGGDAFVAGGSVANGAATAGNVNITAGNSDTGTPGNVLINPGETTAVTFGYIKVFNLPTADPGVSGALYTVAGVLHVSP